MSAAGRLRLSLPRAELRQLGTAALAAPVSGGARLRSVPAAVRCPVGDRDAACQRISERADPAGTYPGTATAADTDTDRGLPRLLGDGAGPAAAAAAARVRLPTRLRRLPGRLVLAAAAAAVPVRPRLLGVPRLPRSVPGTGLRGLRAAAAAASAASSGGWARGRPPVAPLGGQRGSARAAAAAAAARRAGEDRHGAGDVAADSAVVRVVGVVHGDAAVGRR